jgi:DNA replication protein DnaC
MGRQAPPRAPAEIDLDRERDAVRNTSSKIDSSPNSLRSAAGSGSEHHGRAPGHDVLSGPQPRRHSAAATELPHSAVAHASTGRHESGAAQEEELLSLRFIDEGINAVLLGPNGVGKTMLLRNIAHQAALRGHTVRFPTASDMLADLAAQESSIALTRRLRRYCQPRLLCVDEVGYLSYNSRYADLLFEVVTRRYDGPRSILLSTNKPFAEWSEVFPHAACVVTLIDRLLHRAEIIDIHGDSFRLKEAKERAAAKVAKRSTKRRSS